MEDRVVGDEPAMIAVSILFVRSATERLGKSKRRKVSRMLQGMAERDSRSGENDVVVQNRAIWCLALATAIGEDMFMYEGEGGQIRGIYGGENNLGLPFEEMLAEGKIE